MGRLPVKYLRFSLLVASVFIFAGSARASDNKNISIDIQSKSSSTTVVSSSSISHDAQSASTDNYGISNASTMGNGSVKSTLSGTDSTISADKTNTKKAVGTTGDKAVSLESADNTNNIVSSSTDQSPLLVSAKISGQPSSATEVSAPISAKLVKYKVASRLSGSGESAHYASSQPSLVASQPTSPAASNHGSSIPASQSEMLVSSLSHLLLSPNILSKMTGLGFIPVGSVAIASILVALVCFVVVLVVTGLASSYISNLKKSRYWHAARSITLPTLLIDGLFLSDLAQSKGFYRRQILFILNITRLNCVSLSMGEIYHEDY